MLTTWPAGEVIVLAIAHRDSAADVYTTLLAALDLAIPEEARQKPPSASTRITHPPAKP